MICRCSLVLVQFLQVFDEVVYSLCVEKLDVAHSQSYGLLIRKISTYLADDLRRLSIFYCFEILLHCRIIISLLVKEVSISPEY